MFLHPEEESKMTSCKSVDDAPIMSTLAKGKKRNERKHIASASTALVLGGVLGLFQTIILIFLAKPFLSIMGVKHVRIFYKPLAKFPEIKFNSF